MLRFPERLAFVSAMPYLFNFKYVAWVQSNVLSPQLREGRGVADHVDVVEFVQYPSPKSMKAAPAADFTTRTCFCCFVLVLFGLLLSFFCFCVVFVLNAGEASFRGAS